MMFILLAVHIFFTFRTGFIQRLTFKGVKYSAFPDKHEKGIGTYKAFASALGTTIGPGNITGVAVAISAGGAGAVLWMWLSGILAMSTKYVESYLSMKYVKDTGFTLIGGTGVLLERAGYARTSYLWTLVCAAGGLLMGAAVPSSSLSGLSDAPPLLCGVLLSLATLLTISFGLSGIANVSALLVPVMSVLFIVFCVFLILLRPGCAFAAIKIIFAEAFDLRAGVGGAFGAVVRAGVTRGLYSNESGLGTGGVMAAESGDKNIVMSSAAAMTTVFWDTVVMCALCGVVMVAYGGKAGDSPKAIMSAAFGSVSFGNAFVSLSMSLFVFATVIGWFYIAKRALSLYFSDSRAYELLYVAAVFFGAVLNAPALWAAADTVNLFMLAPSLFVLIKMYNNSLHNE